MAQAENIESDNVKCGCRQQSRCILDIFLMAMLCSFMPSMANAQKTNNSEVVLRKFMQVCNGYSKQIPFYVNITVQNSTDLVTHPWKDTATYNIEVYIQQTGAYLKVAGQEEVVSDSLVLLIDNRPNQIEVFANNGNVAEQLSRYSGGFVADSNLYKFAQKYDVVQGGGTSVPGINTMRLTERLLLPGSSLPGEEIEVQYKENALEPVFVRHLKRKIVPLDTAQYNRLMQDPVYAGRLVHPGGKAYYLIKEDISIYHFNQITHGSTVQLPLTVGDFIRRRSSVNNDDGVGQYIPTKRYKGYKLLENL